ncbi:hypothetical protein ON010_g4379 [Phytophthora cinnamomi]|nr:hypothetical protein ON010_g4379 [Phytophthora cinnamomi]
MDSTSNLQVRQVVDATKSAVQRSGLNPEHYGSRSLRSGGATALFNAGYDGLAVNMFGRWKSDAVERFTRLSGRLTAEMAAQMLAKPALKQSRRASSTPLPGSGGASMQAS